MTRYNRLHARTPTIERSRPLLLHVHQSGFRRQPASCDRNSTRRILATTLHNFGRKIAALLRAREVEHPPGLKSRDRHRARPRFPRTLVRARLQRSAAQLRPGKRRQKCTGRLYPLGRACRRVQARPPGYTFLISQSSARLLDAHRNRQQQPFHRPRPGLHYPRACHSPYESRAREIFRLIVSHSGRWWPTQGYIC